MSKNVIALFTTAYPEGQRFFLEFVQSLKNQTDLEFDIWIGLDRIKKSEVKNFFEPDINIFWIEQQKGETPASLRQRAIELMIKQYFGIIFVDSDDILASTRVESARMMLNETDVGGCALSIINENSEPTQYIFQCPEDETITSKIPLCYNVYGLSNTVYRSDLLAKILPIPSDCILVDWFLATSAWIQNARFSFDSFPRMQYRQYTMNTARIIPPFTTEYILKATRMVISHYHFILTSVSKNPDKYRILIEEQKSRTIQFLQIMEKDHDKLSFYVQKLNEMPSNHIWWDMVAHPHLEELWKN